MWQADNIMNQSFWSIEQNKFIEYNGIKKEEPVKNNNYISGKLWQYIPHSMESIVCLKIIKYIRKHYNRITLIGIDNDTLDRDYDMYKIIMKNYLPTNINFLWAHNHHVSTNQLSPDTYKYIDNKSHKWYCGYYLKKKLKNDYCIVLSQAYQGVNRFNSYCAGKNCSDRTWQLKYIYEKFKYPKLAKYVNENKKWQLLKEFNEPIISFSNSYYKKNADGVQSYDYITEYNYVLFWNKVNCLLPYFDY